MCDSYNSMLHPQNWSLGPHFGYNSWMNWWYDFGFIIIIIIYKSIIHPADMRELPIFVSLKEMYSAIWIPSENSIKVWFFGFPGNPLDLSLLSMSLVSFWNFPKLQSFSMNMSHSRRSEQHLFFHWLHFNPIQFLWGNSGSYHL